MKGSPRSDIYDDVYFSVDDGLAESRYVFLEGNDLPRRWQGAETFTICETGFGTGLNLLALWDAWDKDPQRAKHLHFISFEKHPLKSDEMADALEPWRDVFGDKIDRLLAAYPDAEFNLCPEISVHILYDDVNAAIPKMQTPVDCWFLDGFTPSKNPEMWSETLFENMGRLSDDGTSLATFTAAGFVKRGLQSAGFSVSKRGGFGRKRDMLIGEFAA